MTTKQPDTNTSNACQPAEPASSMTQQSLKFMPFFPSLHKKKNGSSPIDAFDFRFTKETEFFETTL
jgi:hypothetical protein